MLHKTTQFKRKEERFKKKNYDMGLLNQALKNLSNNDKEKLSSLHHDHKLFRGGREMHVSKRNDDWLVYYEREGDKINLIDMGGHDELHKGTRM